MTVYPQALLELLKRQSTVLVLVHHLKHLSVVLDVLWR